MPAIRRGLNRHLENKPDSLTIDAEYFTPEKVNHEIIMAGIDYLDKIKKYYTYQTNNARGVIDNIRTSFISKDPKSYRKLISQYENEELNSLVTGEEQTQITIVSDNNTLIRNYKYIYFTSDSKIGRSHLYAPDKRIGNLIIDTFIFNLIVMWLMSLVIYLAIFLFVTHSKNIPGNSSPG